MKNNISTFLLALTLIVAFVPSAQAQDEAVQILSVSINTPLPTGLESMPAGVPEPASFVQMVLTHSQVQPLLDSASQIHKDIIDQNLATGEIFYQEGNARINCDAPVILHFSNLEGSCSFELTKSYGWYADLDLAFYVTGYVMEADLPAGTSYVKNSEFVTKQ